MIRVNILIRYLIVVIYTYLSFRNSAQKSAPKIVCIPLWSSSTAVVYNSFKYLLIITVGH